MCIINSLQLSQVVHMTSLCYASLCYVGDWLGGGEWGGVLAHEELLGQLLGYERIRQGHDAQGECDECSKCVSSWDMYVFISLNKTLSQCRQISNVRMFNGPSIVN